MSQHTYIECDAPDCTAVLQYNSADPYPWFQASLQVTCAATTMPCDDHDGCSAWGWSQDGARVDACSREHLRIALAVKIADLTDEPAQS